ncbi:glycosyl transferase family 2 [Suttonella sp. R2A3]|uniref:LpxL/LpxP family acyltransferase n=1 Tax=Suttonella sp. R2A3 TaxID=2908648 RepID=UPI001F2BDDCA|nr:glycosyl transferase family 2 [Suttonella sp. R2A3]UJF23666.1 glycosyl transferase family 2 [Suttonella sp. R2A3]
MALKHQQHWATQKERGNRFVLLISAWMARTLPLWLLKPFIHLIAFYYYLSAPSARRHITAYQRRLSHHFPDLHLPPRSVWRQFAAFAQAISDQFAVWQQRIVYADLSVEDPDNLYARMNNPHQRGELLICAHLGNNDVCRALASHHRHFKLNVLVYHRHAVLFNQALNRVGADKIRLFEISTLDAATMFDLQARLARGEWLAIAADRVPVKGDKTVSVPFLGDESLFAQGPWLLAGLLDVRVNVLFCTRQHGRYHLQLEAFAERIHWSRSTREQVIKTWVARYSERLAQACARTPLQWFNFYDFWGDNV